MWPCWRIGAPESHYPNGASSGRGAIALRTPMGDCVAVHNSADGVSSLRAIRFDDGRMLDVAHEIARATGLPMLLEHERSYVLEHVPAIGPCGCRFCIARSDYLRAVELRDAKWTGERAGLAFKAAEDKYQRSEAEFARTSRIARKQATVRVCRGMRT
jgi:hypothetical protein